MASPEVLSSLDWLHGKAVEMARASRRTMADGTAAFPPQVGEGYGAFWLRDYAYMLEGCIEAFSDDELRGACRVFVDSLGADGSGVDCVALDGHPIYKPGWDTMGENPVADGGPFTIDVAWRTYERTRDRAFLAGIIDRLVLCLGATPRDPANGLVYIDPATPRDRCPYGFTDTVVKQGDELFCSLLLVRACGQLADLLEAVGRDEEAAAWRADAHRTAGRIRGVFWHPETGLFHAATVTCDQPDLWGSAFAVYLGVARPEQALSIARWLRDHHEEVILRGQARQLPAGMRWERTDPRRDGYQDGGFWGTPMGWICYTVDLADPALADSLFLDMVRDYQAHGVWEHHYADQYVVAEYNASAALPLAGICAMLARRAGR